MLREWQRILSQKNMRCLGCFKEEVVGSSAY